MSLYPSTVTRYPYSSKDAHHKITYGTAVSLTCKYAKISKIITDSNNKEVLAVAWTQFPAGTTILPDDKIVLPDGTFSKIIKIHNVNYPHNAVPLCVEVYYGEGSV